MTRFVASLAVAACIIAVVLIVKGATSDDTGGSNPGRKAANHQGSGTKHKNDPKIPAGYVVQPGDTVTAVARKFHVPVPKLEQLNPDVDPRTLNAGVTLKLR